MLNSGPALVLVYGRGVTFYESLEVSAPSKLILTNEKVGTGFPERLPPFGGSLIYVLP